MKELFIIRHAKSSWENSSLRDFDRPLNKRGKRDAPRMAKVLSDMEYNPDLIISSPANRAITTAKTIAKGIDFPQERIQERMEIYGASVSGMLDLINKIDDKHNRVYLFGHNPTFTMLAEFLSGEYFGNLPTCGIIGLGFDFDSWKMISAETGDNFYYGYPKKYD